MNENPTYDELKRANELLREKVRWLEGVYHTHRDAGSQVQSRFLSNISHEIRTPMNAIMGFSHLLQEEDLAEHERDDYLKYISMNSKSLLKVMENIIDLTLLETDNFRLRKEDVFVDDIVKMLYQSIKNEVIREMQIPVALLITMPRDYGRIIVQTDGDRLQRLLDTLLTNAITTQKKGVVEIKLEVINQTQIRISVIVNRIGLLSERAQTIFEKPDSEDDRYNYMDNNGIAYKLAREVIHEMGGKVSLVPEGEKRLGLCMDLPVDRIGIQKKIHVSMKTNSNLLN